VDFGKLTTTIRTTVRNIEEGFSVDIGVKDIDIEKEETIASAQRKLSRLSEITDR
jgi:hypothetical protein